MSQFQVYRLPGGNLVLDLQTDLIDPGTRVVAPLIPLTTGPRPMTRMEPVFEIGDVPYALHTAELAAIPERMLRATPVADLTRFDHQIRGALDMVFSGF